jgi:flavin reductase (DIM6/NTAB) family NADH-FMN oxidoreductase RutF
MSFLNQDQEDIAQYFALDHEKRSGEMSPEYKFSAGGVPILKECNAYIICHVEAQHEAGDHSIFVARITEANVADLEDGEPLVFYQSRFTGLKDG